MPQQAGAGAAKAEQAENAEKGGVRPMLGVQERRVAIVFVDLVESVRLMRHHQADAIARWRKFSAHVREQLLPAQAGRVVRSAGDGLLLEFAQAPQAVAAVLAAHAWMGADNAGRADDQAMLLRVGVHLCDVVFDENEAYGEGVNLAARLMSLAQPGQTVVSSTTRDQLADGVHATLHDMGQRYLKGMDEPVRAFRAEPVDAPAPGPRLAPPSEDDMLPAVAVVPFVALPADPAHDALGHAMADDIIAALSRHAGLRVLSRASTSALRGETLDLGQVRQVLGAAFLLSGRYYVRGSRVRLSVELAEVNSAQVLWAGNASADVEALFAGNDELVPQIVGQVGQQVLARELARVRGLPMDTLASYTLYLGATGLMNSLVLRDFERARPALEHLIERHPRQASPYAMLARWHVFRTLQGWSHDRKLESLAAHEHARRAMDIDPSNALALTTEGMTRISLEGDVEGSLKSYLAALDSNPSEANAWAAIAGTYSQLGLHEEACNAARRSLQLSPLDPNSFLFEAFAAMAFLGAGRFDEAVRHAQSSLRRHALHAPTHRLLVGALWLAGRKEDARAAAKQYLVVDPSARAGMRSNWNPQRPQQDVWAGAFNEALRAAGVPA